MVDAPTPRSTEALRASKSICPCCRGLGAPEVHDTPPTPSGGIKSLMTESVVRGPANWIGDRVRGFYGDHLGFCQFFLPGSANSASSLVKWPHSRHWRTQLMDLNEQLKAGIRLFDIKVCDDVTLQGKLYASCKAPIVHLHHVLKIFRSFLRENRLELVAVRIQPDPLRRPLSDLGKVNLDHMMDFMFGTQIIQRSHAGLTINKLLDQDLRFGLLPSGGLEFPSAAPDPLLSHSISILSHSQWPTILQETSFKHGKDDPNIFLILEYDLLEAHRIAKESGDPVQKKISRQRRGSEMAGELLIECGLVDFSPVNGILVHFLQKQTARKLLVQADHQMLLSMPEVATHSKQHGRTHPKQHGRTHQGSTHKPPREFSPDYLDEGDAAASGSDNIMIRH